MEKRTRTECDEAGGAKRLKLTTENLKDEALILALRGMGLDVDYWANVLKNECGVTEYKKLKLSDNSEFQKLDKFVRHSWEMHALKTMLHIHDSYEELHMHQKEKAQKQIEHCNQLRCALVCERDEGKTRSDNQVKKHEYELKQTLQIPDDVWVKSSRNLSLAGLIDNFGGQLDEMRELGISKNVLSATELLKTASNGLALKGILVTNDARVCANVRETIIDVPKNVSLVYPTVPQRDAGLELASQGQTDQFNKSRQTLGHSIAVSRDGLLDNLVTCRCSTDEEMKSESSEQVAYQTKVNYSYIPTASCELEKKDLVLCKGALKDLKELERQVEMTGDGDLIRKMSEDFLKEYGSHVNTSVVFGGVHTWQATYSSEDMYDKDKVHHTINDALDGLSSMSSLGLGIPLSGSIMSDQVKAHVDIATPHDKADLSKITMSVTKVGGPQNVTSHPLWKMGLLKCSKTWALIDRGSSFDRDFVGIWDLVQNQSNDFSDAGRLSETLQRAWEVMNGRSLDTNQGSQEKDTGPRDQLLAMSIQGWTTDEDLSKKAVRYLQQLLDQAEKCCTEADGPEFLVWKLNTDRGLHEFLKEVMAISEEYSQADLASVFYHLNKILIITQGHDLLLRDDLAQFVKSKDEKYIPFMMKEHRITSIARLVNALNETLLPATKAEVAKANPRNKHQTKEDTVDAIYIQVTRDIEVSVEHLRIQLIKANKHYELFLLQIALYERRYDMGLKCFSVMFSEQSLLEFVQKIEALLEGYLTYTNEGLVEMQAFLIERIVLALPENSKDREQEFQMFLSQMENFLTTDIAMTLARFYSCSPYLWHVLLADLDGLKKGNNIASENSEVDLSGLVEIGKSVIEEDKNLESGTSLIPDDSTTAGKLLMQLGLTEYYPSKISLQAVMSVGSKYKEDHSLTNLPWRILQKLIMLDYNARDNEPKATVSVSQEKEGENQAKSSEGVEAEFTFDTLLEDCNIGNEISLNPLDVFHTVYCCCDMLLKQALAQKMFTCRLAIPIISPQLSGGSLQYSLWALRSIIVEWKNKDQVCVKTSVVSKPIKTVSFLRLGKPSCSKSMLLNHVISDQAHPTFWNRECPLGSTDHVLANGLVEGQWYLPSGKPTDVFEDVTMFLNLRGDACNYQKQVKVLQTISDIVVCCLETDDLANPDILEKMKNIHDNSSKVVLVFAVKDPAVMDKQLLRKQSEQYLNHIGKSSMANAKLVPGFRGNKVRTMEDLKQEMRKAISKYLADQCGISIEVAAIKAEAAGIQLDETDLFCTKGKELAQEVISCLENESTNDCKRQMLPLQGEDWQEWSKLLRDEKQSGYNEDSIHGKAEIQVTMTKLRNKQLAVCNNLSELMKTFLKYLLEVIDSPTVGLYLQWLKIYLDEKSRNTLPGMHREYHEKWLEFHASTGDAQLAKELKAAELVMAEASLGLEHLMREVTQMYEAAFESKLGLAKSARDIVDQLPRMAAKLLLRGQPIEAMDGDAANVPLTWVKAVFSSLAELVGDKKLFVLSVLGIQSSGKSTLLNTMFGLQFAVSAGRCTRGVYMQLIAVDKERSDLPYDYVLVVDTEGLRAPELGQLKYDNDNQLATFVIGLADVTILNIKGENVVEVSDVLQIAVHAFLRMKIVNKNFQLHRTCVFIHQNVPAVNAREEMQHGCQKLRERLDEMTREASGIEDIVDIHTFNEVIKFDGETNVWYFSDLWHGDPPMAPANPGYSQKVQEVKDCLLNTLPKKQQTFLSILDMKLRVEDLWKGVLSENFVFSFRNSLAAKAYNNLETAYHEKSWDVENKISEWITQEATVKLERCSTEEELETCGIDVLYELQEFGTGVGKAAQIHLDQFFSSHPLKDIVIEWKTAKMESLKSDIKQFIQRAEHEILQRKESIRVDLVQNSRMAELNIKIMTKAKNLADELKGNKVDENKLQQLFQRFWTERVNECANGPTSVSTPIVRTVRSQLYKRLEKDSPTLHQELHKNPVSEELCIVKLEGSISRRDIEQSDISVCNSKANGFISFLKNQPNWHQYRNAAEEVSNSILRNVDTYLQDISKLDSGFKENFATNVIKKVVDGVDEHNQRTEQTGFTLPAAMKVKVTVHACRYAVGVFKQMQREYDETQTMEKKLEAFKRPAWSLYKHTVKQSTSEMIAADLLSNHLEVLVEQAVRNRMSGQIVNYVVRYFNRTKFHLIVRILTDLTEGPFGDYISYIQQPKEFSLRWITSFTNKEIFADSDTARSQYVTYADEHIDKLAHSITKSVTATTEALTEQENKVPDIQLWIQTFCDTLHKLPVKADDLKPMLEETIEDFENLKQLLMERLKQLQERVLNTFKDDKLEDMKWEGKTPYKQILDRLWGCKAVCPFCSEVCQRTDPNHLSPNDSHQCIQHRPIGVRGSCWEDSSKLIVLSCGFSVSCGGDFYCESCRRECKKSGNCNTEYDKVRHPFKEYKKFLPDWDIAPSPNMESSKYWMWVMATYKVQLATAYNAKVPDIPEAWNQITKEEALDSLREYY